MTAEMIMQIENLEVLYYESIRAIQGISIEVPWRKKVAILGANGAGKTTLLRAISGLLGIYHARVSKGEIFFEGAPITRMATKSIVRKGLCFVQEGRRLFRHLTVEENLIMGGTLNESKKITKDNMEKVFEYFPLLRGKKKRVAGYLSGGEQQMLVLGTSLMFRPRMLAIDELSLGLSPLLVQSLSECLNEICDEQSMSVLLVEQNAEMALAFASYGYVIENGRVVLGADSEVLRNERNVKDFYLGATAVGEKSDFADQKPYKRIKRWL